MENKAPDPFKYVVEAIQKAFYGVSSAECLFTQRSGPKLENGTRNPGKQNLERIDWRKRIIRKSGCV